MISDRIETLAAKFWEEAGTEEPFPRNLEVAIHKAKPSVAIVSLERLCPQAVRVWLAVRDHQVWLVTKDRWVDGCLYACKGIVFLFVEQTLGPDHRRVTIAHEFGHFLADYEEPRRRADRRLGPSLLSVFDGDRPPTAPEQLSACLADVSVEPHVHFMDRMADGSFVQPVSQVERTANELAFELLAPWRIVFGTMRTARPWPGAAIEWRQHLEEQFGLPRNWAGHYAEDLRRLARARRSFTEALGM
ncbi:MAG: hypothetical protein HY040_07440 [Planctomycetes bacterium]|nr:hypothetical protein [Planctomycetota bacterium]